MKLWKGRAPPSHWYVLRVLLIEGISRDQLRLFLCRSQTIKDVTGHWPTWSLSGIESETDLILAQS